jgi:hypothetical protein
VPLTLLDLFATFIQLVDWPVALAVATVVLLAGRGPLTTPLVLVLPSPSEKSRGTCCTRS